MASNNSTRIVKKPLRCGNCGKCGRFLNRAGDCQNCGLNWENGVPMKLEEC